MFAINPRSAKRFGGYDFLDLVRDRQVCHATRFPGPAGRRTRRALRTHASL